MRERIVEGLNELLDIDHDAVSQIMTLELILPAGSNLKPHPVAYTKEGVRMVSALTIISQCLPGDPIRPVFEDGIIQRFE